MKKQRRTNWQQYIKKNVCELKAGESHLIPTGTRLKYPQTFGTGALTIEVTPKGFLITRERFGK